MTFHRTGNRLTPVWFVVPALGILWAALFLRGSYFFYDEWGLIRRAISSPGWRGATTSFNGHLVAFQSWAYDFQVNYFGLDSHLFIVVVFLCVLCLVHVILALLFRSSGMPALLSLLLGGHLTYLGAASQNFIFVFQAAPILGLVLPLAAASLALSRRPSAGICILAGSLMLVSVGVDSGTAAVGVIAASVVIFWRWRGWAALTPLPSIGALATWYLFAARGPQFQAGTGERLGFAAHLFLRAAGALMGGGELWGIVILILSTGLLALALHRGYLTQKSRIMLVAGTLAAGTAALLLAQSRAGIENFNFVNFNRYLGYVATPLALALAPGLVDTVRGMSAGYPSLSGVRLRTYGPAALVAFAFLSGLSSLLPYSKTFHSWNVQARNGVQSALAVIADGCPSGHPPSPTAIPMGTLQPQTSTEFLSELLETGRVRRLPIKVDPAIVHTMCDGP